MAAKLLNDRVVQNAKPKSNPYRLADGDSLYLIVLPTASKSWQLRYRHNGVPQTLTLGKLELVELAGPARGRRQRVERLPMAST